MHWSERARRALERAAEILAKHGVDNELEAYWLLVRHERELGYPVTYEFVVEALRRAEELHLRSVVVTEAKAKVEA